MDPQQGFVLHVGYDVLHTGIYRMNSNLMRNELTYCNIGVFVGVEASGIMMDQTGVFSATGASLSITSGRLSYALGLVGPCYSVDTACSSALAASHVSL